MKTLNAIWIYVWAYFFIALGFLDWLGKKTGELLDKDWFAGLVVIGNVAAVLHMIGVW